MLAFLTLWNSVYSSRFSKLSPSIRELCYNAYVGQIPGSCSWHPESGTVRVLLPAGTVLQCYLQTKP